MWKTYQKTWIPTQIFVISLALILHFYFRANIPTIAMAVIVMEIGAVVGAAWSGRLQRKIAAGRNEPRVGL